MKYWQILKKYKWLALVVILPLIILDSMTVLVLSGVGFEQMIEFFGVEVGTTVRRIP